MLTSAMRARSARRHAQRGLSLVEMMVGIAVGLIVVAGASVLVSTQLGENRRLLIETQLQQDMRAAMDIISREVRRMGAQREAVALLGLASAAGSEENPMARQSPTVPGATVNTLEFHYQPTQGNDDFGFRLTGGVVQSKLSTSGWQDLTDRNVLNVTALNITPLHSALLPLPCPRLCPNGTNDCWPNVTVRSLEVEMVAEARNDPNVVRKLTSVVRVRNDVVDFIVSTTQICPA